MHCQNLINEESSETNLLLQVMMYFFLQIWLKLEKYDLEQIQSEL